MFHAFERHLTSSNIELQEYHELDLPSLLRQMEALEEFRMHAMSKYTNYFSSILAQQTKPFNRVVSKLVDMTEKMTDKSVVKGAVRTFVAKKLSKYGEASNPEPFVYGLPCSPLDVEKGWSAYIHVLCASGLPRMRRASGSM